MLFVFLPVVSIASIPVIGHFVVSILETIVETWNAFLITFPYAVIAWHMLLWVILPFEILMAVGKFFFGNRMPSKDIN